ncbi:CRISPR-associated RAMP protein Csx7 [Acidianus manzaensis]|uniref:CRISPR-associated RAMP protein n=1 Tax=Acidianus manzaensis TaxID=282676 RepID=A0A1W6JWF8_9CREN|nr:CRISPR-associated RAMP protein Csx7 [Acidianus manzaensis]ARM74575.1 CRISPR-associated RAMP protein [Acidianus manzaensis]
MSDCYDLDRIVSTTRIEGILRNETPLRIGSGRAQVFTSLTDNPVLTLGDKPVIPGSTLKGVLRSLAEAYMRSQETNKGENNEGENNVIYKVYDLKEREEPSCKEVNNKRIYCIPCILFGFHDISSRVFLFDAVIEGNYSISMRTMVTINRVFGGQHAGHLYTLDFVDPGASFKFNMIINNLDIINGEKEEWKNKAVEVMRYLLKTLVNDGVFVGGRKSVGYGLVKLVEGRVSFRTLSSSSEKDLKELISSW